MSLLKKINYTAFDPGKANGVAFWDSVPNFIWMDTWQFDELPQKLSDSDFSECKVFIIERFLVYPHMTHRLPYNQMITSQAIGILKGFAHSRGIKVVEQNATIKTTGYKWLGRKPPSKTNPNNHSLDAVAHGTYYLVSKNLMTPPVLGKVA